MTRQLSLVCPVVQDAAADFLSGGPQGSPYSCHSYLGMSVTNDDCCCDWANSPLHAAGPNYGPVLQIHDDDQFYTSLQARQAFARRLLFSGELARRGDVFRSMFGQESKREWCSPPSFVWDPSAASTNEGCDDCKPLPGNWRRENDPAVDQWNEDVAAVTSLVFVVDRDKAVKVLACDSDECDDLAGAVASHWNQYKVDWTKEGPYTPPIFLVPNFDAAPVVAHV